MEPLYFFYLFATFSIGLVSLGMLTTAYVKTRDVIIQYYLYFHSAFTALVVANILVLYITTSLPHHAPATVDALQYFAEFIAMPLLLVTIPVLVHHLLAVPHPQRRNIIWDVIIGIAYSVRFFVEFVSKGATLARIRMYLLLPLFLALLLYHVRLGLSRYKRLEDPAKRKLARNVLIFTGIALPAILYDIFRQGSFRLFPLVYCGITLLFRHYALTQSLPQVVTNALPNTVPQPAPEEAIFQRYQISQREKEVMTLLIQGYSNDQIAEALCISLSTVKTHLRKIYPKCGVKNRHELIALFRDMKPVPPSSEKDDAAG